MCWKRVISILILICLLISVFAFPVAEATSIRTLGSTAPRLSKPMVGIDVSSWNQEIDWAKVKAAGVEFAMVRIFHHLKNTPNYELDEYFERNVREAQKYDIQLGAYFFSYAQNLAAITNEANMVVNELNKYPGVFTFPIVFDAEDGDSTDDPNVAGNDIYDIGSFAGAASKNFCDILSANGYYPMVYSYTWYMENKIGVSNVKDYDIWLASYPRSGDTQIYAGTGPANADNIDHSKREKLSAYDSNVTMWQYTGAGKIDGIYYGDGGAIVDLNVCYVDYPSIIKNGGYNGTRNSNISVYAPSGVSDFYAAGYGTIPTSNHDLNPHIYITGLGEDSNKYKGLENYSTNKNNIMINGRTLEKWESRTGGSGINNVWIYGVGEGNAYLGFELASTNILRLPGQTGCGEILQTIVLKRGLEIPKANDNYWDSGELAAGDANFVSTAGILKENVVLVANSNGSFTVVTSGSSSYNAYGYTFTEKTAQIVKLSADANIRKGPDSTYASIGVGLAGATYEYLDEIQNTKWLKVDYNGQVGWISNVNAGVVNVPQYVTVTGDVNIRSGPSSSYDILSVGLPGDTYEYLGELSGSFYKISYNGQEAWMSKNYATLSTAPQIMTVTAGNAGWSAMDHTPQAAVIENQVASTCCEEGSYDEVIYCSVCNEEISRVKKTIPLDEDAHNWGEWTETKKATESEAGEETRICKNDSNHIETKEIPAFGVLCNVAYNKEEHFIFAGEDTVYTGHDYSFAIEPAYGYEVRAVVFDMRILEAVDGIYTIENVQGNLDILIIVSPTSANPEAVTFTVTFVDHEDNIIDEQIVEYGQAAIAPEDQVLEGYTFKGWDSEFDYVTKDITVKPVFVKTPEPITVGKLIVMVVGGSGFEINGRPQGVNYTNTNMAIGTSVTLVAKSTENHTFLGWLNATTGVVASTSETFTFKATGSDSYQAVYHTRIEGINLVIFKNDKAANGNGQIIDMQYYAAGEKVEYPADTARTGYEFTGWDHTPEQIQAKLEAGQDVVVLPTWRVKEIYLKVSVNNGAITSHGTTDGNGGYLYNQGITVKADEAPIGQKFAYWVDQNGKINSYKPEYSFFLYYDKELTAVYVDEEEEIEYEAIVGISANTTVDDVRIGYSYFWEVPDALGTFVQGGVLVVEQKNYKEETFVAGVKAAGLDSNVTESIPSAAQVKDLEGYTSNKLGSQLGTFWYAKSYVQYIDANGELQTVYSDMIEAAKS